jgi:transglutaminase-like putative cysteine protease
MTQLSTTDARAPHLPLAELALATVTMATVLSFSRLFVGWSFFWPLTVVVAYSHLAAIILRRRDVGIGVSALVSSAGFVVLASWTWFASSTTFGIPDASTWTAFTTSLRDSWSAFQELTAPVPVQTGFLIAAAIAVFFAVFLADWAAFRLWSPVESLVPALTLFVFCTLLGSEHQRMLSAFAFCAASLFFLLAHRVARLETSSGWLTADIERGSRWLFRAGTALAAVAVVGGVVVGPRLPTANDTALVDWREGGGGGPSSRVTVSPLVDINGRLVDQRDVELFTVETNQKSYWRLTALDTFDGEIWRSGGRYGEAGGDLGADTTDAASDPVTQHFEIERLGALWLPAAFQPVSIETEGFDARYERSSDTLIVDTKHDDSDQLSYRVISEVPAPTPEQLATATSSVPDEMSGYLELPGGFSDRAVRLAREIPDTAGATNPYESALAIQDFFRDVGVFANDDFTWQYDTDVQNGHSNDAIEAFLDGQRGYCEMFAGTYAAMARAIGLPSRVAVGFTWGDEDPSNVDDPNDPNDTATFRVKGKHAHAWPEVWLGETVGWVAFEPTPGRGAPSIASYTGISVEQTEDTAEGSSASSTTTTSASASSSTTAPAQDPEDLLALLGEDASNSTGTSGDDTPFVVKLGIAAMVLLALLVIYAGATLVYGWLRRRNRRRRATVPGEHVAVAWQESLEDLELLGIVRRPSETHGEFATRAGSQLPERERELDELATLADVVTYASDAVTEPEADQAEVAAGAIAMTVRSRVPRRTVWFYRLDPRRLQQSARGRPRQQARASRG